MPVYLVQLDLRGPNLPLSFEACKLRQGTRHRRNFFELRFILSKPNWSKIFIYQVENGVLAFEN
jgi:hypothetical protein